MKNNKRTHQLFYKLVGALLLPSLLLGSFVTVFADDTPAPTTTTTTTTQTTDFSQTTNTDTSPSSQNTTPLPSDDTVTTDQSVTPPADSDQLQSVDKDSTDQLKIDKDPNALKNDPKSQSSLVVGGIPIQPADQPQSALGGQTKIPPQVDNSTGALKYSFSITVPPGRNNFTPDVSIDYNSQNTYNDSVIGYGWSLSIPYIQRENKHGVDNLYTGTYKDFTTSDHGELGNTSGSNYQAKSDYGSFSKYSLSSNVWTQTTKTGLTYTYGTTAASRQDDPGDATHIYKWMLDSITDANGNSISYTYYKNQGQIYPDTITYTNTSGGSGPFTVTFGREAATNTISSGYVTGFNVTTQYRINTITSKISGTTRHSYALAYTLSDNSTRSLLSTATETGYTPGGFSLTLPPAKFNYTTSSTRSYDKPTTWTMPTHTVGSGKQDARLGDSGDSATIWPGGKTGTMIDVNGDGYPDWIETENQDYNTGFSTNGKFYDVYLGSSTGWTLSSSWTSAMPVTSTGAQYQLSDYQNNRLADINGDGLPDWIISTPTSTLNGDTDVVWLNTGTGWAKTTGWTMPTFTLSGITYGVGIGTSAPVQNGVPVGGAPSGYTYYSNLVDVNNDGLVDIVLTTSDNFGASTTSDHYGVWLNTGTGWTRNTGWTMPVHPGGGSTYNGSFVGPTTVAASLIIDVNGDGLPDWVETNYNTSSNETYDVWINSGTGWVRNTSWVMPVHTATIPPNTSIDPGVPLGFSTIVCNYGIGGSYNCATRSNTMADVNGDGLPDFIETVDNTNYLEYHDVWLNNGSGWTKSTSWTMPFFRDTYGTNPNIPIRFGNTGVFSTALSDVNADGLVDIVASCDCGTTGSSANPQIPIVFLNTGKAWSFNGWNIPSRSGSGNFNGSILGYTDFTYGTGSPVTMHRTALLQDINNDGVQDWVESNQFDAPYTGTPNDYERYGVWANTSSHSDLLNKITYPHGGFINVSYKNQNIVDKNATTQNQGIEVVDSLTTNDGLSGTPSVTSYAYTNGKYFYPNNLTWRKFAGFQTVTATNPDGSKTIQYFHQGDGIDTSSYEYSDAESEIGRLYRTDITDASGNLYKRTTTKWDKTLVTSVNSDVYFVYPTQTIVEDFDGNGTERATAETFAHTTSTGNLNTDTYYGEVTATTPIAYTDIGTDKQVTSYSYASNVGGMYLLSDESTVDQSAVKVRQTRHYYDTLALGSVTAGNETKTEKWKTSTTYINTQKSYNANGTVATSTDGRGKVTSYSYDTLGLYPTTVTDPMTHATQYTYDYMFGKVLQTTDQNSNVYLDAYDGMGRIYTKQMPDPTTGSSFTRITYGYGDYATGPSAVEQNVSTDSSLGYFVEDYYDGLGRLIEERRQTDPVNNINNYETKDYWYNVSGQVAKQSLPYNDYASAFDRGNGASTLNTTYTYDPEGRVLTAVNNIGTTTNSYDQWMTTTTDPRGKVKKYYYDANANLVKVDEIISATTYSTQYAWDLNKDLTKITDSSGNIRNFTYDGINRRLTAQDLHASADATFGTWTYTYDDANNLTQSISPNSATTNYTYDNAERKSTEDYTGVAGTEITNTYDSCTQGVGKLCSVTMSSGANTAYTYNYQGLLASENKTINSTSFVTGYTYNRAGNIVTITYPDSSVVLYGYLSDGLVGSVQRKESGGSYTSVISSVGYSPDLKISTLSYANGTTTTNTYDPLKLYRLTNKLTQNGASVNLQNIAYTYDANGNLTNMADTSATNAAVTGVYTYDDLNRLTQAALTTPGTSGSSNWYNASWGYRVKVNIPASSVSASLTDFPVYVDLSTLPSAVYTHMKTDASDFRVTKSDGTTELPYEVVSYNSTTHAGEMYVKYTGTLSSSTANSFYIYYGNAAASAYAATATYGRNAVWSNYAVVSHDGGITDSTGNHTPTNGGSTSSSTAKLGSLARGFASASSQYINYGDDATLDITNATISAWGKKTSSGEMTVVQKAYTTPSADPYSIWVLKTDGSDLVRGWISIGGTRYIANATTGSTNDGAYHYLDMTYDGSAVKLYMDGALKATTSATGNIDTNNAPAWVGNDNNASTTGWNGQLDEIRVRNAGLPAAWISAEYSDQNAPTGFYSLGTEEAYSAGTSGTLTTYNYAYDALGNITSKSDVGGTYTYAGNTGTLTSNPHAATSINGVTYTYDSDGNLTTNGTLTNTWNYKDQVTQTVKGAVTVNYYYDQDGNRVWYKVGAVNTYYPNKYYNYDGTTKVKQIYIGDTLIATVQKVGATVSSYYVHTDNILGSNVVTDSTGAKNQLLTYLPFGDVALNEQTTSFNEQAKYGSHFLDQDSGLNYLGARYYSSKIGRFISEDPTSSKAPETLLQDPQSLNTYSYANNNPLTNIDPTGLFSIKTGTVDKGDTLSGITTHLNNFNGTNYSVSQIASLNNIKNVDKINVGQVLIPNQKVPDITQDLTDKMHQNSGNPNIQNPFFFKSQVQSGGNWDLKNQPGVYCSNKSCGGQVYDNYVFNAEKIRFDAPGNIHYGYVGSNSWYGVPSVLHYFAGTAQNSDNGTSTGDDTVDAYYINKGINLFKNGY